MRLLRNIAAIVLALLAVGAASAQALTLQPVGTFVQPTYVTSDPGDAGRLFVVERKGTIQLLENGVQSKFADISAKIGCGTNCQGERGLMSIALAPDFDQSGRLFVDYANDADGTIHVDELVATGPGHDSADISTLRPLLSIAHPVKANHNGGQLQFGPDGYLYISTGDGGGENDEFHNAQNPSSQLGKILRLDPNSAAPYVIWNLGLRNPYRFSFDRLNGDMVIGDVGQSAREEIDFAPSSFPDVVGGAGNNYGWNCREGFLAGLATDPQCATPPSTGYTEPVFDYPHTPDPDLGGSRCSLTGGYVVRDAALGALYGTYIYSDYCSGVLRSLRLPASAGGRASGDCSLGLRTVHPVSFGEDAAGRLYVVEQGGVVSRFTGLPPTACPTPLPAQPQPLQTRPSNPTFVGIKAQRRRVERGKRALLTVFVSPCSGRKGTPVRLLRNGRTNGSKYLNRACTARFLPRVRQGTTFTAATREERGYLPGRSRHLTVRLAHRKPR
jgi:hypothetical protein